MLHAPHFTQYVKDYIEQKWPGALYGGGLEITTSIDVELQEQAEEIVRQGVNENVGYSRNNAAMVVMVPWSGEILAMVGSADFNDPFIGGQVNYALAKRQPGSSIKPIVYAAAFESGWNPGTVVMDIRISEPVGPRQPNYEPNNYTGQFYGAVSVRTALANSLNIPAVKAIEYAGIEHVMDLAQADGDRNQPDRPPTTTTVSRSASARAKCGCSSTPTPTRPSPTTASTSRPTRSSRSRTPRATCSTTSSATNRGSRRRRG